MGSLISKPAVTASLQNSQQTVANTDQAILFVGQFVSGTATDGVLVENIGNSGEEDALFGATSMLAGMIRAAREDNAVVRFDAIPLADNGSGVAATGTAVFVGTASAAGTLIVTVGSEQNHAFSIAVASGDSITDIGDAVDAAVLADTDTPFTSNNVAGTVTFTAVNKGTLGNGIGIAIEGTVAGITHSATAMASGATDPVLTSIFDVITDKRYQGIVWPYAADTAVLRTLLDDRFNVDNNVLDGVGFTSLADSLSNHSSLLGALNEKTLVYFTDKLEANTSYKAPALFEMGPVISSRFAAIRALRLTDGVDISDVVITTNGALDGFGGTALASKPYFNTPFSRLPLVDTDKGWTDTEIATLEAAGGSVIGVNRSGTNTISGSIVTTYKTDVASNPDVTWKFLNYVDTGSAIREYYFNNLKSRFPQSRLTAGDVVAGRDQANKVIIEAFCEKLYQDLSGPNFVLVQAGEDSFVFFKENLVVVLDVADGLVTIQATVKIVTQLREILMPIKIDF